jgi:hypothetical protein
MKNRNRFFWFITLAVILTCFTAFLTSCGPQGGTIIVENNFDDAKMIEVVKGKRSGSVIMDVQEKGSAFIPAGATKNFPVDENGDYHVLYYVNMGGYLGNQRDASSVSVSGGEAVHVKIPH